MGKNLLETMSPEKIIKLQSFILQRFSYFESLRTELDEDVRDEVELYNNIDRDLDARPDWWTKSKAPILYTLGQTITARVISSLFGKDNWLRLFMEDDRFQKDGIAEKINTAVQHLVDVSDLKYKARDFIEDGLVQRVSWLYLRPVFKKDGRLQDVKFDVLSYFDVFLDTMAESVEDTDLFIRFYKKHVDVVMDKNYMNTDLIKTSVPPDNLKKIQRYEAQAGVQYWYDPSGDSTTDQVELMTWFGRFNMSEDPEKPDFKEIVVTWANRQIILRVELNEPGTIKKKYLFPIRPFRQPRGLIGKGLVQLAGDLAKENNVYRSLRHQNAKVLVGMLFKYNRNAEIPVETIFAGAGNAIPVDDPEDITPLQVPNLLNELSFVMQAGQSDLQMITGAVDYVLGVGGRGETASGVARMTDQAMFKFSMIVENIAADIQQAITYMLIMYVKYGRDKLRLELPVEIQEFFDQSVLDLEETRAFDLDVLDLAQKRDVERSQWLQAINIIAPLLGQVGGNPKELFRSMLDALSFPNTGAILGSDAAAVAQQQQQKIQQMAAEAQASGQVQPGEAGAEQAPAMSSALPSEIAEQQNVGRMS